MLTTIGLCLLNLGYLAYLAYDIGVQSRRGGKTLTAVRLRRRATDAVNLAALALLTALVLTAGFRYPKWRLKKDGFTAGGRYWPYRAISAMRLSEDGVLVLTLESGQNLILPVARIDDLEHAAAFFTGEEALQHLINLHKEKTP